MPGTFRLPGDLSAVFQGAHTPEDQSASSSAQAAGVCPCGSTFNEPASASSRPPLERTPSRDRLVTAALGGSSPASHELTHASVEKLEKRARFQAADAIPAAGSVASRPAIRSATYRASRPRPWIIADVIAYRKCRPTK